MQTLLFSRGLPALLALALAAPLAARAGDSTPPQITHAPAHALPGQPVHVTAHIVDESHIFPQLFFRYGSAAFEPPIDLKKVKGAKDEYEANIPIKPGAIEYYLECYDEFGNGPARAGSPESPLKVILDDPDKPQPALPAPVNDAQASSAPAPAAEVAAAPAAATRRDSTPIVSTRLAQPATPWTARDALWHSAVLPGWGQYRTERRVRGLAFGIATGASLFATLWYTVRAHQANTIYVNAPISVRSQAYDQAVNYADARNSLLGLTIGLWALNVAESWALYGTKDPW